MIKRSLLLLAISACTVLHAHPTPLDLDPHEVRNKINEKCLSVKAEVPEVYSVEECTIEAAGLPTPLRIYRPSSDDYLPLVLCIHGGGWVAGNLETHDNLARYLCKHAKAIVVLVGYLNSPEGKFPLPLEQCYDTLQWAQQFDASSVAVVGDSAGGNMAAALCLMARDRGGPKINFQALINPAPNLTCRDLPKAETLCWMASMYVQHPDDINHPYASPALAADLSHLPPALITVGELDLLRPDGEFYANRLSQAGVQTEIYCQKGVGHLSGNGARASTLAQESLNVVVTALQNIVN